MQELKAAVKRAEADRTLAQQGLHELQLQMREAFATRASARNERLAPKDANVHGLISAMEEQGIGGRSLPLGCIAPSYRVLGYRILGRLIVGGDGIVSSSQDCS